MVEFRFQIGEVVTTKQALVAAMLHCAGGAHHVPMLMTVVERRTQECPGGVQIHYACGYHGETRLFNDIELAPLSEFNNAEAVRIAMEAERTRTKARHRWYEDMAEDAVKS